jgi:DnaJ family protein A protein 5
VRKRDPRYKLYLQSQSQINGPHPPIPSSVVKAQRKLPETYVEQDWQRVDVKGLHNDLDWAEAEGDDLEEWECVACRKTFRSEAAWDSHERSKKHMKEVERLKREMQADDQDLDLNGENKDEAIYTSDQLLTRHSSSSINLVAEDPPSVSPLLLQSANDSDNYVEVPNAREVLDAGKEEGLKTAEKSGKRCRDKIRKQTSDLLVSASATGITKPSNVKPSNGDDVHLVSSAESPISQVMSKRDKRGAKQAKEAELEANNLSVWMSTLSIHISDQHLLAMLQLLCPRLRKQNSIIQPYI